MTDSVQNTGL